ncbi:MAG TPA: glycosyltransferase [Tepidisphaeraceae bacterium]|jgi:glycosyltransferase involved in cell wall biosynthesis
MPSYNVAPYIDDAIESILAQTYGDFEFLITDDGSTDGTAAKVQKHAQRDSRIRFFPMKHEGYVKMLRFGLSQARGTLIARMDSDDFSLPNRFARQVEYFERHPQCVAVGSQVILTDPYGTPVEQPQHPTSHEQIENDLLSGSGWAIVHPAAMMRKAAVDEVGGYDPKLDLCEDVDLFLKLGEVGRLANLPEVLVHYRQHPTSVNHTKHEQQQRVLPAVVAAAYERRGKQMPADWTVPARTVLPAAEQHRRWGWSALKLGKASVARKHALAVLRRMPLSPDAWRLTACAIRGY